MSADAPRGARADAPRYSGGGVTVRCADCFAAMPALEDNSVDFVATDPPYFLDGFDGEWNPQTLARKMRHNGVVQALPAGMKFDREQGAAFQRFCARLSAEVFRALKPGGFFVAFSQGRLHHRLAVAAEDAGFEIRDMLAWRREGQAKAFSQDHFVRRMKISKARKGRMLAKLDGRKTPQLKPQMEPMMLAQKPRDGTFVENWMKWGVGLVDVSASLDGNFPGTVMEVPKPKNGRAESGGHLTVKPVELMAHLLRIFTAEGQVVLDPFLGGGTTAVAALQTGRKCVGFEINPAYCQAAIERVQGARRKKRYGRSQAELGDDRGATGD